MDALTKVLACAGSGLAGGVLSGLFGIGGGIVLVPLMGLAVGLDQHRAQGLTLAAMLLPNGLPAVLHYRRSGVPVHLRLVRWMVLGFLPGVLLGAWTANLIPEAPLRWGFAAFLVLMAVRTFRAAGAPEAAPGAAPGGGPGWPLAIGAVGGLSAGLLGIGGGVVIIPLLSWRYGLGQREAQLQSLVVLLLPLGLPGVLVYARAQGGLPWMPVLAVAAGFATGAWIGARAGTALRGPAHLRAFAGMLVLTALLLVRKG